MSSFADDLASVEQDQEARPAPGSFAADLAALAPPPPAPAAGTFAADLAALTRAPASANRAAFSPLEAEVISSSPPAIGRRAPTADQTFRLQPSAPIGSDIALPKDTIKPTMPTGRLGSAKTGGVATEIPGTMPVLDSTFGPDGLPKVARGIRGLVDAATAAGVPPVVGPAVPVAHAPSARVAPPPPPPQPLAPATLNAASDVVEGAFKAMEPLIVAGMITAPIATAAALAVTTGGAAAASETVTRLGGSPEAARLAGNVAASVVGGFGTHEVVNRVIDRTRDVLPRREAVSEETAADNVRSAPEPARAQALAVATDAAVPLETVARPSSRAGGTFADDLANLAERPAPTVTASSFADDLAALERRQESPREAASVTPQTSATDVLDTGELQPRLPEAGAVRDRDATAAPIADVPFSLEREAAPATSMQPTLREEPPASEATAMPAREPRSVRAPAVEWDALPRQRQREVRRILAEMEELQHAGKTFNETTGRGGDVDVKGRVAGAPVYWDIVGGNPKGRPTFNYSRGDVAQKLRAFVEEGKRSVVSDLAADVAERRLAGDRSLADPLLPPDAGDEPGAVRVTRRSSFANPEQAAVQRRAVAAIENDTERLAQTYRETFDNVVSADNAKELLPDYATKEQRTANDLAVHRPASRLAQHLYETMLREPVPDGRDPIAILTSGGTGSGKSSRLDEAFPGIRDAAHVVYDSALTDLGAARTNIEAAKRAGHDVLVVLTDRDVHEAFDATLERAREHGRPVTINTHVATHMKAPTVFDALREEYHDDPHVTLAVIRNSTADGWETVPVGEWEPRRYNQRDVRVRLAEALDAARARLGEPLYEAIRGAAEDPAAAARDEAARGRSGVDQQPAAAAKAADEVEPPASPKPSMPRSRAAARGTTLEATVLPGARQFAEQDLAPALRGAAEMGRDVRDALSPSSASPNAQATADTVRHAKATIANAAAIESSKYGQADGRLASALRGAFGLHTERFATVAKHFSKFSDADNVANISAYERTGEFAHAPAGYSDFYKRSMTDARGLLQDAYGEDRVGLVENYVRRAFVFGSKADEAKGVAYLEASRSSLSADKSPTKGRVLDMPLDEALATMKARGISVKLAVSNPEVLRQWSVSNARQAVAYADAWRQLKEADRITFVKPGDRVPEGAIPLDDRAARVFFPTDKGLVQAGSYYADPAVARVLNNTISQGLGASPTFRGIRTMNNALNQLQLGVSGFHFTGVAINTGVSDLALGLREIARGATNADARVLGRGVARAAGSVVPFQSFARDLYHGRALVEGLKNGAPEAAAFLEQKLNPAGGRLRIDARYRNQAYENMVRAFRNDNYIGAALRLPAALIEQTAKPLMEYAIPRVKLGAFMDLAHDITERMPHATPADLHRAYANAWDSIDNRFGQLVYDNLFWNKTAQDLAQVATRSVGWNLGTVREIGGGLADFAMQTTRGRGVSDRALYTAALPIYVGVIGATYQYLKTGERPSELKDYFYPRNGRTEPNGMASRTTLPTYMKDVYAYSSHPIDTVAHKQSPLLELAGELVNNEDFFGTMIRNPEDPSMLQLQQVGAHVLRSAQPFSLQQFQRTTEEGGGGAAHAESFFGFTKASASIERSPAETLLHDYLGPATRRTPEQRDRGITRADFRAAVKAGDGEKTREIAERGQLTRRQLQDTARTARLTGLQVGFKRLGLEQALNVYEVASPAERGLLATPLDAKVRRADETLSPADVERVGARITKVMMLPRVDSRPAPPPSPSVTRLGMPAGRPQTRNGASAPLSSSAKRSIPPPRTRGAAALQP